MGIFGIEKPLDQWAQFDDAVVVTLVMQLICLSISLTLFLVRLVQVVLRFKADSRTVRMLNCTSLCAMLLSTMYVAIHFWNYRHYFLAQNDIPCDVWFFLVIIALTTSKTFVYLFLMLRSSVAFQVRFFQIPLPLSTVVIIISTMAMWTVSGMMLSDFTSVYPFPGKGFCFRLLGETGTYGILGYNLADALCCCIALVIFTRKACFVKKSMAQLAGMNTKESADMMSINAMFNKHIVLGALILMGPIILFWLGEALTVLLGIAGAVQQTASNICIFLIFKENARIYNVVCRCCVSKEEKRQAELGAAHAKAVLSLQVTGSQPSNTMTVDGLNHGGNIMLAAPNTTVLAVLS